MAATAARPASTPPRSSALIHATSRHRSASLARAYAAARCVLPTPRIPVTARTTTTRDPGPGASSAASRSARGWNPSGSCGISPATTTAGACPPWLPVPVRRRVPASSRKDRSTNCPSMAGLANDPVTSPLSRTRRRNASCRAPNSRSINADSGIPTSAASMSSRNTNRSKPASVAVSNSSSVYDTSGRSRTGEPYRVPSIPTYASHPRTRSAHSCAAGWLAAGNPAMSTITCPAAETARSTAATYDIPGGNSRSSEV